jgi:predicted Rossmann fold flavoprotein
MPAHGTPAHDADLAIVGAGAAGLMAGISAARQRRGARIVALDVARKLGAKILVAGGGRCNVTNARVSAEDFHGGSRHAIRRVLAALPVPQTVAFFEQLGVALHEEAHGKLFPDSNSGRTVLAALLGEAERLGIELRSGWRVESIGRDEHGFAVSGPAGRLTTGRVILSAGGMALPKSGSDGSGYALARQLGHTIRPPLPALVPLLLDGDVHAGLSGVAHAAQVTLHVNGRVSERTRGALLWTHFGVSGPVALDASGGWHRARHAGHEARLSLSFLAPHEFAGVEAWLLRAAADRPRMTMHGVLAEHLPARVVEMLLRQAGLSREARLAHLDRDLRRRLVRALVDFPLPVRDSRGFTYAEVTSGGVPLDEVDPRSMASRRCPGLWLAGEILDVDGRIGGFNFQWAWSSGHLAGLSAAGRLP